MHQVCAARHPEADLAPGNRLRLNASVVPAVAHSKGGRGDGEEGLCAGTGCSTARPTGGLTEPALDVA